MRDGCVLSQGPRFYSSADDQEVGLEADALVHFHVMIVSYSPAKFHHNPNFRVIPRETANHQCVTTFAALAAARAEGAIASHRNCKFCHGNYVS